MANNEAERRDLQEPLPPSVTDGFAALTGAPGAKEGASDEWPEIPAWMVNPLVFRDANLGIVLVAGAEGEQMLYRIHTPTPFPSTLAHWCSVRKVDERDGFQFVDALNLPKPVSLPPPTVEVLPRLPAGTWRQWSGFELAGIADSCGFRCDVTTLAAQWNRFALEIWRRIPGFAPPVGHDADYNASLPDWPKQRENPAPGVDPFVDAVREPMTEYKPPVLTELSREEGEAKFEGQLVTCDGRKDPHLYDPHVCLGVIQLAPSSNHDDVQDAAAGER